MEILRRYYSASVNKLRFFGEGKDVMKLELLMNQAGITPDKCKLVAAALNKEKETGAPAGALELPDGTIITGKTSSTLGAASALLLNALKTLGGIDDELLLISAEVLEPICELKTNYLKHRNPRLHTDEVLMSLTVSALTNPIANKAKEQLANLHGSNAHFSVIISEEDEKILRRLGINVSCEAKYESKRLYHNR